MSTHADVIFAINGVKIVKVFHVYDGYISSLGKELAEWLMWHKICNGFGLSSSVDQYDLRNGYANGAEDLAAQWIAYNKTCAGDVYVYPLESSNKYIDYTYFVNIKDPRDISKAHDVNEITVISVTCWDNPEIIFKGSPKDLLEYKEFDEEE
jgi:hypothetical protein